jgi:hypothetical protein
MGDKGDKHDKEVKYIISWKTINDMEKQSMKLSSRDYECQGKSVNGGMVCNFK